LDGKMIDRKNVVNKKKPIHNETHAVLRLIEPSWPRRID